MSEELKAVLEAIQQLGGQGISAFIWYMVLTKVGSLLETSVCVGGLYAVFRTIGQGIYRASVARQQ